MTCTDRREEGVHIRGIRSTDPRSSRYGTGWSPTKVPTGTSLPPASPQHARSAVSRLPSPPGANAQRRNLPNAKHAPPSRLHPVAPPLAPLADRAPQYTNALPASAHSRRICACTYHCSPRRRLLWGPALSQSKPTQPSPVEAHLVQSNAVRSNAVRSNAIRSDAVQSNAVQLGSGQLGSSRARTSRGAGQVKSSDLT